MDPQKTKDGKPYGPARYEELVKERYVISSVINTSYNEVGQMTPTERTYIIKYIINEREKQKEQLKELENRNSRK